MGRIKTKALKTATRDIAESHGGQLSEDFEQNKQVVNSAASIQSKKLRNIIAGYATRLKKQGKC